MVVAFQLVMLVPVPPTWAAVLLVRLDQPCRESPLVKGWQAVQARLRCSLLLCWPGRLGKVVPPLGGLPASKAPALSFVVLP